MPLEYHMGNKTGPYGSIYNMTKRHGTELFILRLKKTKD